jgi:hypothetical protein
MQSNSDREKSKQDWEKRCGQSLSDEDYKQICANLDAFFTLLQKWDSENQTKKEN